MKIATEERGVLIQDTVFQKEDVVRIKIAFPDRDVFLGDVSLPRVPRILIVFRIKYVSRVLVPARDARVSLIAWLTSIVSRESALRLYVLGIQVVGLELGIFASTGNALSYPQTPHARLMPIAANLSCVAYYKEARSASNVPRIILALKASIATSSAYVPSLAPEV